MDKHGPEVPATTIPHKKIYAIDGIWGSPRFTIIVVGCLPLNQGRKYNHRMIYKDLQLIKDDNMGLLNDFLQKKISSISGLQDKLSAVVDSDIQRDYRAMSSSNLTATTDTSSFSTSFSTSPGNNQITPQKGSTF